MSWLTSQKLPFVSFFRLVVDSLDCAIRNPRKALQNSCWHAVQFQYCCTARMRFYTRLDSELKRLYSTRSAVSSFVSYVFRFAERPSFCHVKLQTITSFKAATKPRCNESLRKTLSKSVSRIPQDIKRPSSFRFAL